MVMDLFYLLNSQKDSIFKIIVNEGFNPHNFKWEDHGISILKYRDTTYYCKFQMSNDPFARMIIYSPGSTLQEEHIGRLNAWKDYENAFKLWLFNLKRELNSDFLWDRLRSESSKYSFSEDLTNESFSPYEKKIIHEKFESIKLQLSSLEIDTDSLSKISEKLDHVLELTEKLNKVDWLSVLIGSMAGLFLNLAITQDTVRSIWEIIKHEFEIWLYLH
jgi:hypothetical protein